MVTISEIIKEKLAEAIEQSFQLRLDSGTVHLERPANEDLGDWATNVAMTLAKELQKSPREISRQIVEVLNREKAEEIEKIEIAGPGFINFFLAPKYYIEVLGEVIRQAESYGRAEVGNGKKVMVEFGQPNTHKAFHVGHLKSAISGLAMVKLHENLGYEVVKANYFGDVGMQVAKSTWGFRNRPTPEGFDGWNVHKKMQYIDEGYIYGASKFEEDPKAEAEIRQINKEIYEKRDTPAYQTYLELRAISLEHQADVWKTLGVTYDRQYPESEVAQDGLEIVNKYRDKLFRESQGALIFDGSEVGLKTWVFITQDGTLTYSAKDLGLAYRKFKEYPDLEKSIVTTSVEQVDYFKAIIYLLGEILPESKGRYIHIPFGWLLFDNRKKSSRVGGVPKGLDVIGEIKEVAAGKISQEKEYTAEERAEIVWKVAIAGLKFLILSHEFHKNVNYNPEVFLSMEGFSGPYILYSYARAKSILSQVDGGELSRDFAHGLAGEGEITLLKSLERFPDVALKAGVNIAPHLVCNCLYEVAQKFNQFYTNYPVLTAGTEDEKASRLALTQATAIVLRNGLNLLGIETVERM